MTEQEPIRLYHWDNPESKVRFIEMAMKGKAWHADILIPHERDDAFAEDLQKRLGGLGISASYGVDLVGNKILHVASVGDQGNLINNISQLGVVSGAVKTLDNSSTALFRTLAKAVDVVKYTASDNARLIGAIYLAGDLTATAAPAFNKSSSAAAPSASKKTVGLFDGLKDPYNLLQYAQGISTIIHSVILAGFAKEGKDLLSADMQKQLAKQAASPSEKLDVKEWLRAPADDSLLGQTTNYLHRHALPVAAGTIIAGQVGYVAAGLMRINRWNSTFRQLKGGLLTEEAIEGIKALATKAEQPLEDIIQGNKKAGLLEVGRGTLSIAAWASFIHNSKEHENKADWAENPLGRLTQEYDENPERAASILSFFSSSIGIMAGAHKGNWMQKYSEGIYLVADALIFVTKKKHYGEEDAGKDENKIEAASQFISTATFAVADARLPEFLKDICCYMLAKEAATKNVDVNHPDFDERKNQMVAAIQKELAKVETPYQKMIAHMATMTERFPEETRSQMLGELAKILAGSSLIIAQPQDIIQSVEAAMTQRAPAVIPYHNNAEAALDVIHLLELAPAVSNVENIAALYEVCEKYIRPEKAKSTPDFRCQMPAANIGAVKALQEHSAAAQI